MPNCSEERIGKGVFMSSMKDFPKGNTGSRQKDGMIKSGSGKGNRYKSSGLKTSQAARKAMKKPPGVENISSMNILQAIHNPAMILDLEKNVLAVNEATIKKLGKTEKELIGKKCYELLHPQMMPFDCPLEEMLASKHPETVELELETLNGWFLISCSPILDKNGHIYRILHICTDISEQKAAARKHKALNLRLQHLLTSTSATIYTSRVSGDYGITFIGDNVKHMTGYKPIEFTEDSGFWINHVHPEDREVVLAEIMKILKKQRHGYEYRFLCKDGKYKWFYDDMNLILDDDGNPLEIIGFWLDITRRKKAQKKLRESEQKYQDLLRNLNEGIVTVDLNLCIKFVNPHFAKMLGYAEKDIVGKSLLEFVDQKNKALLKEHFEMRKEGLREEYTLNLIQKGGRQIFVRIIAAPVYDEEGVFMGSVSGVLDMTEQKKAEEALRESEATLKKAEQIARIGNFKIDVKTNEVTLSDEMYEIFDIQPDRFKGSLDEMYARIHKDDLPMIVEEVKKIISSKKPYEVKTRIVLHDGTELTVLAKGEVATDASGRVTEIVGAVQDITERVKTQAILEEERDKARRYLEVAGVIILALDCNGTVNLINKKGCEILGYKESEIVGKNWFDNFLPERFRKSVYDVHMQAQIDGLQYEYYENPILTKKGEERIIAWHNVRLGDERGNYVGTLSSGSDVTERRKTQEELKESHGRTKQALEETVRVLVLTAEKRDPYTAGHQERVAQLATAIARDMGLSGEEIEGIRVAGSIHDIGKIYIPAEILNKPGKLSDIEMSLIRTHPEIGFDLLKDISFPWPVAKMVLQHHERLDGSGYPRGIRNTNILPEARILAVADVVEAMASHRPYRPAHDIKVALKEIDVNSGVLFDPEVVKTCLKLFSEGKFRFK